MPSRCVTISRMSLQLMHPDTAINVESPTDPRDIRHVEMDCPVCGIGVVVPFAEGVLEGYVRAFLQLHEHPDH